MLIVKIFGRPQGAYNIYNTQNNSYCILIVIVEVLKLFGHGHLTPQATWTNTQLLNTQVI